MSYIEVADLKVWKGINSDAEDDILNALVGAGKELIDGYTHRVFEAATSTARTFRRIRGEDDPFQGRKLWLGDELAQAADSITGSPTVIYLPEGRPPYTRIMLDDSDTVGWTFPTVVTGRWAYSVEPPASIVEANLRISAWLYDLRSTKPIEFVMVTAFGRVIVPSAMPADVKAILDPFVRVVIGG